MTDKESKALKATMARFAIKQDHEPALGLALLAMTGLLKKALDDKDEGTVEYYMTHLPEMLEFYYEQARGGDST